MSLIGVFSNLFGGGQVGGVVKTIADVVDRFVETPDEKRAAESIKAKMEMQKMVLQAEYERAMQEYEAKIADIAGQNIRAETQSKDAYVRRARPTFLYVMIAAIAFSVLICPLINLFMHKGLTPMEIPAAYLELFGISFLGYVGARTYEKTRDSKNVGV